MTGDCKAAKLSYETVSLKRTYSAFDFYVEQILKRWITKIFFKGWEFKISVFFFFIAQLPELAADPNKNNM